MKMCYDGALAMPSSYVVMNEEEMTYVEGGKTRAMYNVSCNVARNYFNGMRIQCRAGAIAAGAGSIAAAAVPIVQILLGVGGFIASSVLWSWAEAYGNADIATSKLMVGKNRAQKVHIVERTSGYTLNVDVVKAG